MTPKAYDLRTSSNYKQPRIRAAGLPPLAVHEAELLSWFGLLDFVKTHRGEAGAYRRAVGWNGSQGVSGLLLEMLLTGHGYMPGNPSKRRILHPRSHKLRGPVRVYQLCRIFVSHQHYGSRRSSHVEPT